MSSFGGLQKAVSGDMSGDCGRLVCTTVQHLFYPFYLRVLLILVIPVRWQELSFFFFPHDRRERETECSSSSTICSHFSAVTGFICLIISRWAFEWRSAWKLWTSRISWCCCTCKAVLCSCVAPSKNDTRVSNLFFTPHEPERGEDCGNRRGVAKGCFWSHPGLVSMLADTLLLFGEISVRPSPQFISSHNHKLSKLSHSRGSACRQVSVSTAAEPKYLSNPPSLFNYLRVLEKWRKPSCIYDALPASPMTASKRGRLVWTVDDEQRAGWAWNGIQVRIIKRCLN